MLLRASFIVWAYSRTIILYVWMGLLLCMVGANSNVMSYFSGSRRVDLQIFGIQFHSFLPIAIFILFANANGDSVLQMPITVM